MLSEENLTFCQEVGPSQGVNTRQVLVAVASVGGNTSEALADRNNRRLGELCGYAGPYVRGIEAGDNAPLAVPVATQVTSLTTPAASFGAVMLLIGLILLRMPYIESALFRPLSRNGLLP